MRQTPEFNQAEALAFVESMRLTLAGKVGFRWMVEKLSSLASYIELLAEENRRLNAYVDRMNARSDYDSFCAGWADGDLS